MFTYNVAARSNFGILVRKESEIQGPEGLRGKVIGTSTADGAEVGFTRNVMSSVGMIAGEDFEFLTVGDAGPATVGFTTGAMDAYSSSTADAAILNQRGMATRDITPPEIAHFFGNGIATLGDTIKNDPELVEKFIRAYARGHAFALDDANRAAVLAHLKEGNRQEGEYAEFQSALFDAVRSKTIPVDMTNGLGYLPPEVWEEWQASVVADGDLAAPLDDLTAAYTTDFSAMAHEALK